MNIHTDQFDELIKTAELTIADEKALLLEEQLQKDKDSVASLIAEISNDDHLEDYVKDYILKYIDTIRTLNSFDLYELRYKFKSESMFNEEDSTYYQIGDLIIQYYSYNPRSYISYARYNTSDEGIKFKCFLTPYTFKDTIVPSNCVDTRLLGNWWLAISGNLVPTILERNEFITELKNELAQKVETIEI